MRLVGQMGWVFSSPPGIKPVSVRDLVSVLDERVVSSDTEPDPARNRS